MFCSYSLQSKCNCLMVLCKQDCTTGFELALFYLKLETMMRATFSRDTRDSAVLLSPEINITGSSVQCLCFNISISPQPASKDLISLKLGTTQPDMEMQDLIEFSGFVCGFLPIGSNYRIKLAALIKSDAALGLHEIFLEDSLPCQGRQNNM